ncbi:hypothetical protein CKAH01_01697 [Colletotrichum kahawae]|uniref:Uncharacterized protein n=1 Tax=Colletotrichum kahawae TaxID=34407 RepID=A0AAE0D2C9_COLKA|nr:hypothetical protein CKAH01_01697 [Colletotrichum kahawae]
MSGKLYTEAGQDGAPSLARPDPKLPDPNSQGETDYNSVQASVAAKKLLQASSTPRSSEAADRLPYSAANRHGITEGRAALSDSTLTRAHGKAISPRRSVTTTD